jgi:signal transduction histidine kinase
MFSAILDPTATELAYTRAPRRKQEAHANSRAENVERQRIEENLRAAILLMQAVSQAQLDFAGGKSLEEVLGSLLQTLLHALKARQLYLREEADAGLSYEPATVHIAAGPHEAAVGFAKLMAVADRVMVESVVVDRVIVDRVVAEKQAVTVHAATHDNAPVAHDAPLSYVGVALILPQVARGEQPTSQQVIPVAPLGSIVIAGRADYFTTEALWLVQQVAATAAQLIVSRRNEVRRRAAELALAEERALFAQRVAARTGELERAVRLKDEFMATMNHEMRTPLHALLLYTDILQAPHAAPLNERQQRAVSSIRESAHHLLLLINDTLDVAKMDAGRLALDIKPTEIESLCQSAMRIVAEMARKKQIELEYENSQKLTHLEGDERRIKQMLVNLLSNAIKFTPDGGQVGLQIGADDQQDAILFTVWDTGSGIAPDEMKLLFQPFVQLKNSHPRQQSGTGLGLFLVARMCELHGGCVSVSSEVGKGSRFTIALPHHQAQATLARDKVLLYSG